MATVPNRLSLEEFHRLYDGVKPYYEYWFGEAIQKPMATALHGVLQFVIMMFLRARGWNPASEVTLKLVPNAEPIPDIVASRERLQGPYPTKPVGLCVEILSPDDRLRKVIRKGKYYLGWGVATVWIVDPQTRSAWMMTLDQPDAVQVLPDGNLVAADTEISLREIFAEVDQMFI